MTERGPYDKDGSLCVECQNVFNEDGEWQSSKEFGHPKTEKLHTRSFLTLAQAANSGCHLCSVILSSRVKISEFREKTVSSDLLPNESFVASCFDGVFVEFSIERHDRDHEREKIIELNVRVRKGPEYRNILHSCKFDLIKAEEYCFSVPARELFNRTWSTTALSLVKSWTHQCWNHHKECISSGFPRLKSNFPTRLLEIGDTSKNELKLIDTAHFLASPKYVTLSHCWGAICPVRLLSHSIASFQRGISITQLPRTFAEAIEVCQQLDLRYIWIDALCIIQDSEDDWAQEAARMRDIYSNSCLTIAATASTDGSGGLFFPRDTGIAMPFQVITKWSTFDPSTYICSLRDDGGLYDRSVNIAVLNQRAWVLQERLLSRCVLHFAENQIYWQCATLTASEINPQGIWMGNSEKNLMNWTMIQDGAEIERRNQRQMDYLVALYGVPRTVTPVAFTGRWMTIVITYSKAKLTYCTDKLVALSGLARRMSEIGDQQPQDYLAGLWRFNLGVQLLWYTSCSPRPEKYRAPSWSWASVDGWVEFRPGAKPRGPLVLKIIDAATETKIDPFGQVVGGSLRVQGRLWEALVLKHLPPEIKLEKSLAIMVCHFDIAELQGAIHIYLLPICLLGRDVHGILLEPTGNRKGQFQRVGRFEISSSPTRERSAERILGAILQAEKALEENLYENFDGIDQYSIEII